MKLKSYSEYALFSRLFDIILHQGGGISPKGLFYSVHLLLELEITLTSVSRRSLKIMNSLPRGNIILTAIETRINYSITFASDNIFSFDLEIYFIHVWSQTKGV